jgi:putative acetyltransferase
MAAARLNNPLDRRSGNAIVTQNPQQY